jgi:hypothetical protein
MAVPNNLKSFIEGQNQAAALKELPSVHVTDGYAFREALRSRRLQPTHCGFFNTDLVYFFYGKPSYRPSKSHQLAAPNAEYTAGFILEPGTLSALSMRRVFPFDSGAYQTGLFDSYMRPSKRDRIAIQMFELPPDTARILTLIDCFFGSNGAYYARRAKNEVVGLKNGMWFEVEAYHKLISAAGSIDDFDDRCAAIEIQVASEVELSPSNVAALLFPATYSDNVDVQDALIELAAQAVSYRSYSLPPSRCQALIYDRVQGFYQDRGWL